METRKEKYRRYREDIIHMSDEFFPSASQRRYRITDKDEKVLGTAKKAGSEISFGDLLNEEVGSDDPFFAKSLSPYAAYRQRRSRALLFKFIALFLAVAGLVAWYFLIQGRM